MKPGNPVNHPWIQCPLGHRTLRAGAETVWCRSCERSYDYEEIQNKRRRKREREERRKKQ